MDDKVTQLARQLLECDFTRLSDREQRVISFIARGCHVSRDVNTAHRCEMRSRRVASKHRVVHAGTMLLRGVLRARRFLPVTRRERALMAKLEDTRAGIAAIADVLCTFSALEDKRTHLTLKAARERRSEVGVMATHIDGAVARSKGTAEALDRVTEALERLAASLRDM